ncbi:hypothetical protein EJB05_55297, partial [Eragrostis curvula]
MEPSRPLLPVGARRLLPPVALQPAVLLRQLRGRRPPRRLPLLALAARLPARLPRLCAAAWLVLFFLRGEPLVLCGRRAVGEGLVLAALSALTLVALLIAGPVVNVLASLLVGLAVVLLHAVLHGDVVRWHALGLPVPPY